MLERPAGADKAPDAFRTISEVSDELDLPQHVLRFWETRFSQIRPLKRGGGRRYYRPEDVDLLRGIRHLLYGEGYTIKGVQRILKSQGLKFVQGVWRDPASLAAATEVARRAAERGPDDDGPDDDVDGVRASEADGDHSPPAVAEPRMEQAAVAQSPIERVAMTVPSNSPAIQAPTAPPRLVLRPAEADEAPLRGRLSAATRTRLLDVLDDLAEAKRIIDAVG